MTNDTNKPKTIDTVYEATVDIDVNGEFSSPHADQNIECFDTFESTKTFLNRNEADEWIDNIKEDPKEAIPDTDIEYHFKDDFSFYSGGIDCTNDQVQEKSILDILKENGSGYFTRNYPDYELVGDLKLVLKEDKKEVSESNNSINSNQTVA